MFVTKTIVVASNGAAGHGHDARAAVPRVDGAGVPRRWRSRRRSRRCASAACTCPNGAPMASPTNYWMPKAAGELEITPILKPLEAVPHQMTVVGNLSRAGGKTVDRSRGELGRLAERRRGQADRGRGHPASASRIDQVLAKQIGQETPFPSLEFATEDFSGYVGGCVPGYSCTYMNTISWAGETAPLPMEINPRVAFERMFGRAGDADAAADADAREPQHSRFDRGGGAAAAAAGRRRRIAPASTTTSTTCARSSGASSRPKRSNAASVTAVTAPVGVPEAFEDHAALMFDLLAVAYQADLTRVFTFMMAREASQRTYPGARHPRDAPRRVASRQRRPDKMAQHAKINTHFATLFATFVEKLRAVARRRRLGARSLADRVRRRHERRPGAQRLSAAVRRGRRRRRQDQGQPLHRRAGVDAGRQRLAERGRHVRQPARAVRREHGPRAAL